MLYFCMTCAIAQDLDNLHRSFMAKYDQINGNRDARIEALTEGYLVALDRLKKQLQTTGQLELVLQAQHEIDLIGKDVWPPEELGEKATAELKTLRSKYVDAREKALKEHATQLTEVVDKMEKLLATQIVDLTKAGKIEEAKLAQKMKEDLAKDEAIMTAREDLGKAGQPLLGEWINLWELKEKWTAKQIIFGVEFDQKAAPDLKLAEKYAKASKLAHATSSFEYDLDRKVTELKTGLWMHAPGNVLFIVRADGQEVLRKNIIGPTEKVEFVQSEFKPARKLEFITDMNGENTNDWSVWVMPQAK